MKSGKQHSSPSPPTTKRSNEMEQVLLELIEASRPLVEAKSAQMMSNTYGNYACFTALALLLFAASAWSFAGLAKFIKEEFYS